MLGVIGIGKTTFGKVCSTIFNHMNIKFLCVSVDDFYKTFSDRQEL